jgi:hypothetical protein
VAEEESHGEGSEEGAVYFVGAVLNSYELIVFKLFIDGFKFL